MVESSVDSVKARFSQLKESGLADEEAIETIVRETGRAGSNVRLILFNLLEPASQKLDNQRQKSAKSNSHIADADGKNSDLYIKLIGGVIVLVVIYFIFNPSRPDSSELGIADYQNQCDSKAQYEENCEGKFIQWDGEVREIGDEFVRVKFGDNATMCSPSAPMAQI